MMWRLIEQGGKQVTGDIPQPPQIMTAKITPPTSGKGPVNQGVRSSNIELYRIVVMLLIVAHHYVVNSGLYDVLERDTFNASSLTMLLFGAWGKTGINCFVLITGYFMCKSNITSRKFAKLVAQVLFYNIVINSIFVIEGHTAVTTDLILNIINPIYGISSGFTSCFLIFFLLIPFLNKLLVQLDCTMHRRLIILLIVVYSIMPCNPKFELSFNYVTWFCVLYLVASYIRFYGLFPSFTSRQWGFSALAMFLLGSASVVGMSFLWYTGRVGLFNPYFFISDSNKILSLAIAVSSFMYFKSINIPYTKYINALGAATFGVLLIHANSDTMRNWLWSGTVDCVGHYTSDVLSMLGYASASVAAIFFICAFIDWIRQTLLEKYMLDTLARTINIIRGKFITSILPS